MNLADCLRESALRKRDSVALVHRSEAGRREVTWGQLDADVDAAAAGLRDAMHLRTGDRVGWSCRTVRRSSPATSRSCGPDPARSAGQCPGVELRLVDEDRRQVSDGDPGDIEVRGANLFSGYWPDGSAAPDEDGWWATGDVGSADDGGDLFLVDRRKELVIVNGFNVYPREVEDVICEHPGVAEVAVVAVAHPQTGKAVKAYVVARRGHALRAEDVTTHCATRLARFKRPTTVAVVDVLPHSVTGKVAKGRLREVPS